MKRLLSLVIIILSASLLEAQMDPFVRQACLASCKDFPALFCCPQACDYQACITAHITTKRAVLGESMDLVDPGAWSGAMAACQPFIQIIEQCGAQKAPEILQKKDEQAQGTVYENPTVGGYRVDRCLNFASGCDKPAADKFCQTKGHSEAMEWKWVYVHPTKTLGDDKVCDGDGCGGFSMIRCK